MFAPGGLLNLFPSYMPGRRSLRSARGKKPAAKKPAKKPTLESTNSSFH